MSNIYEPDGFVILKIEEEDGNTHYRVFGSWGGGYLDGDSWRLNSGIESIARIGEGYYTFLGGSGSLYKCHKDSYGRLTGYNAGVIGSLLDSTKSQNLPVSILEEDEWEKELEGLFNE